ncbi:MAG: MFS transporter [Phycisphaerae bacterium]
MFLENIKRLVTRHKASTGGAEDHSSPISRYQVGTLTYTRWGIVRLFAWLLWGDFCFSLMETVMPTLLPLSLNDLGVKLATIGIIMGSIPNLMAFFTVPVISTRSDRHRGRYGRRIPFLFWATPFITIFLILIGYSNTIGTWLHGAFLGKYLHVSAFSVIFVIVCVCSIGFQFFNMFINSIYYYIWPDVVPDVFLGRFMSLFRIVSQAAAFVWSRYIFKYAGTHRQEIYLGIGLLYLVSFMLMCWKIKEGNYPPPPKPTHRPNLIRSVKTYMRECFTHPFYLWFFVATTIFGFSGAAAAFSIFFSLNTLHLSYEQIGKINSWCVLLSIPVLVVLGWLSDKIHPVRMAIVATIFNIIMPAVGFFFVYDAKSFLIFSLIGTVAYYAYIVCSIPMFAAILPRERYGQFCSAQGMMAALCGIVGIFLAGKFIDVVGDYRYIFIWKGVFVAASLIPMLIVYRKWMQYGGSKNYTPPAVDLPVPETVTPK